MRYIAYTLSVIFIASAFVAPLSAQQPDSVAVAIEGVVVTGTGTEHYFKEAPVQTEVITSRMLRSYSGRSLGDILAGLSPSFDTSQGDMGAGLSMGGLGNSYVLILVNGKRLHGDLGGQNDLGLIDPHDIERIEIVKGASSSLYGSDAIAGVVNIITRRHRDIPVMVENTSRIGNYFDFQQHNAVAFSLGRLTSTTKFSLQHTDGWQNSTREWYRDRLWENSTTQTVSAFWSERVDQELAWTSRDKRWDLSASGMYYRKLLVHRAGAPRWRAFNPLYHDQGYNASARFRPSAKTTLTLDASLDRHVYLYDYYNRYIDEFIRPVVEDGRLVRVPFHVVYFPGNRSTESDQRRLTVHGKGVFRPGEKHTVSAGIEWIRDALVAPNRMATDRASTHALAIYGQEEWNITRTLNVTAGGRIVNHRSFGWTATPKVSMMQKLGDWNLRATWSRGFKAPTVKELYYFYERTMMGKLRLYVGNTALRPETSNYFSLGPEYHGRKFSFSLTGSYNRVRNMIELVAVPIPPEYTSDEGTEYDGAMQYVNIQDARLTGVETTFSWRPGAGFSLGGGYSWLHTTANLVDAEASDQAGHTIIERRPVDGTAAHRANVRISWRHDWERYGLDVGLFGRGQTERYYKEYGNAPGYITWRLNTTHRIETGERWTLELSAGIDNILDHVERHPYGYNYGTTTPGRTFFGALTVRFGRQKQR